uniref:Transposase n=1 Tax=Moorena producens (strain JHB) TaxID=1454205 RepID=A0A1D9FY14_MOOP1
MVPTTREETNLSGHRLTSLILIVAIAYSWATFKGQDIKNKGVQKYVGRVKESGRIERRHSGATQGRFTRPLESAPSSFYIGLYGQNWVSFMESCWDLVKELMRLNRNKLEYYLRRAISF